MKDIKQGHDFSRVFVLGTLGILLAGCSTAPKRSGQIPKSTLMQYMPSFAMTTRLDDEHHYGAELGGAAALAHCDYDGLVTRATRGDGFALRQLVRLIDDRNFDGAALEGHLSILRALLLHLGDSRFAASIHPLSPPDRSLLQVAFPEQIEFSRFFPKTAALVYSYRCRLISWGKNGRQKNPPVPSACDSVRTDAPFLSR